MPHIAITMYPGRSEEIKKGLAENIAECVEKTLNVDPKFVSVTIEEIAPENWQANLDSFPADKFYVNPEE